MKGKAYIGDEIAEGNEVIALFMDYKIHGTLVITKDWDSPFPSGNLICHIDDLKYHLSWDWIVPVVENISKIIIEGHPPFNDDQFVRVEIVPNGYVKINDLRDAPIFVNVSVEGSLIKAVWKAVVKFIKWYFENGK